MGLWDPTVLRSGAALEGFHRLLHLKCHDAVTSRLDEIRQRQFAARRSWSLRQQRLRCVTVSTWYYKRRANEKEK